MVTALVLFGLTVVASALAGLKPSSRSIRCMNNYRQLMAAWTMYTSEHSDQVPNNFWIPDTQNEINNKTYRTWVNVIPDWTTSSMNTNTALLRVGQLAPYLNGQTSPFKCPADDYISLPQQRAGWPSRVRSVSMNGFFGRSNASSSTDPTAVGLSSFATGYAQYLKLSRVPKPSKSWVLLDEHPDSINDGFFIVQAQATVWGDIPGSNHNGGCGFAFADGHSEMKQWLSTSSKIPVHFNYFPPTFDAAGRMDLQWLLARTGYLNGSTGIPAYGY
ncbi:MAG TPA: H-X9-DG-CTERM domain-containing protein [Patescibacteria group bacterium]|nr:H-X9-DG-CTERM domain-containing protein [Patescibacteria group bacterium]